MSGAVQTEYAQPNGPSQPASPRRWGPWIAVATVVWAVVLGVLTWSSVRDDGPTVREQRTLAQAGPVVDGAVGELVAAVAADGAIELTPPAVELGCRVTPLLDGATLERTVVVRVPGDGGRELLDRVADRLPAGYRAGTRVTDQGARLRADAGDFVAVEGRLAPDGSVRLTAKTGCRPVGDGYAAPSAPADGPENAAVEESLRALGRTAAGPPESVAAPCPSGERISRTVRATAGPGTEPPSLAVAGAGAAVLVDTPEVYAYRRGTTDVVVERIGDRLRVSASTGCAG